MLYSALQQYCHVKQLTFSQKPVKKVSLFLQPFDCFHGLTFNKFIQFFLDPSGNIASPSSCVCQEIQHNLVQGMSDLNKPKSGKNPQLPSILQQIEINGKHSLSYSDVQFRGPVPCLSFWFIAESHTPQSMPEYVRVPRQSNPVSADFLRSSHTR
ncbi:hypothetical protein ES705_26786 [subsurface metagenome]